MFYMRFGCTDGNHVDVCVRRLDQNHILEELRKQLNFHKRQEHEVVMPEWLTWRDGDHYAN